MHKPNHDAPLLQVQTKQLGHHVQRRLARMMGIVAAPFLFVPQTDAACLGGHEDDFGAPLEEARVDEPVDDEDGGDGAGGVHALLFGPAWAGVFAEVFGGEVASGNDLGKKELKIVNLSASWPPAAYIMYMYLLLRWAHRGALLSEQDDVDKEQEDEDEDEIKHQERRNDSSQATYNSSQRSRIAAHLPNNIVPHRVLHQIHAREPLDAVWKPTGAAARPRSPVHGVAVAGIHFLRGISPDEAGAEATCGADNENG